MHANKRVLAGLGFLLVISLSAFFFFSGSEQSPSQHTHGEHGHDHGEAEKTVYTCPMHPEIRQNEPGVCPICHMKLVKAKKERGQKKSADKSALPIDLYQADLIGLEPIYPQREEVELRLPVYGTMASQNQLALQVFERDLRNITLCLRFEGKAQAFTDRNLKGKVIEKDSILDPSTRTLRVVVALEPAAWLKDLPVESSVTGHLISPLGSPLTLPEEALFFTGQGAYVYIYQDEHLRPKRVLLGPKVGDRYVIREGLKGDEPLSPGPNFLIDSEAKIRGLDD